MQENELFLFVGGHTLHESFIFIPRLHENVYLARKAPMEPYI